MSTASAPGKRPLHDVIVIGAGFSGLGVALRLRAQGVMPLILERADEIGGTWRDNHYPGAACDVPSNLYSYSFAPNPSWSRGYSGCAEIQRYLVELVERFQLRPHIRFAKSVVGLRYDASACAWDVHSADGEVLHARTVVSAIGGLSNLKLPTIPGLSTFEGTKLHSAEWNDAYEFAGKRVAVIGTGASAVQIVPELVAKVDRLEVFQRTAGWVLPKPDYHVPDWQRALFRELPWVQRAVRSATFAGHEAMALGVVWTTPLTWALEAVAHRYRAGQVRDRELRRLLTPDHRIGCKRILLSNDYYLALQRPNCELITMPIASIVPAGVRTADGLEHRFDAIVFATGFDVPTTGWPFLVEGIDGRRLADDWHHGAFAYKSVSVAGYPNLFIMVGPNSGPGHNSLIYYIEAQIDYIVEAIATALDGPGALDVVPRLQRQHNDRLQRRLRRTNWAAGCRSWYLTTDGFNPTMYPGLAWQYRRQMRFDVRAYRRLGGAP